MVAQNQGLKEWGLNCNLCYTFADQTKNSRSEVWTVIYLPRSRINHTRSKSPKSSPWTDSNQSPHWENMDPTTRPHLRSFVFNICKCVLVVEWWDVGKMLRMQLKQHCVMVKNECIRQLIIIDWKKYKVISCLFASDERYISCAFALITITVWGGVIRLTGSSFTPITNSLSNRDKTFLFLTTRL